MKNNYNRNLVYVMILCMIQGVLDAAVQKKPWTLLVYMAADNSLADFASGDLNEMMKIGSNNTVNILVNLFSVDQDKGKNIQQLFVRKGAIDIISEEQGGDSGSQDCLYNALKWAHTNYPSDHFMIVFWDHGSGSLNRLIGGSQQLEYWWKKRAVCYDDTTGNFLTDAKLQWALGKIKTELRNGKKFDAIGFDACLMADVEVAYTLADYADYMAASQETIPGTGFGYDFMIDILSCPGTTASQLVNHMVNGYNKEYAGNEDAYTFSALNLGLINPAVIHINAVADQLIQLLKSPLGSKVKKAIKLSADPKYCPHFTEPLYLDVIQFFYNLIANSSSIGLTPVQKKTLIESLQSAVNALQGVILSHVNGPHFGTGAHGLSIYYNAVKIESAYTELYWAKKTNWVTFLNTLARTH
jgi:hypothetical protein